MDDGLGTAITTVDGSLREALERFLLNEDERAETGGAAPPAVVSVAEGFVAALRTAKPGFGGLSAANAERIGGSAADAAASAAAWSAVIGERFETAQVCAMLGINRQALAKRRRTGSLLGLRGQRTTWFPAWQFDQDERCVKPVVSCVIAAFKEQLDPLDHTVIAAWAANPQPEDLQGYTPADWIAQGLDDGMVITAAHRAAEHFTQ